MRLFCCPRVIKQSRSESVGEKKAETNKEWKKLFTLCHRKNHRAVCGDICEKKMKMRFLKLYYLCTINVGEASSISFGMEFF